MLRQFRIAAGCGLGALPVCGFLSLIALSAETFANSTKLPTRARMKASNYEFVRIEVPGQSTVSVQDINNHRMATGFTIDDAGYYHSFVWSKGEGVPLDHPGAISTIMTSITDSGIVFGTWGAGNSPYPSVQHAAAYDLNSGTWMELPDVPGKAINMGMRMTEAGVAVGSACDADLLLGYKNCQVWTWDGSRYTFFGAPGTTGMGTMGMGINNRGVNVGNWEHNQIIDAFFRYRDEFTPIQLAWNPSFTLAQYINNRGEILLTAPHNPNDVFPASFIWDRGDVTEAPRYPDSQSSLYIGLNDHGDLGGFWIDNSFGMRGLVALRKGGAEPRP